MKAGISLDLPACRRLAVEGALLAQRLPPDADGMVAVLERLGGLQIDPTRTVEKTHLLVLWSRLGNYERDLLDRLLWVERRFFEYGATIVPNERLRDISFLMRNFAQGSGAWQRRVREFLEANAEFRRAIVAQLRAEGPLPSKALDASRLRVGWRSSGWTHDRNVTQILEFMANRGEIAVAGRRGNQRLWDLLERVLPADVPTIPSVPEFTRLRAKAAVRRLGVATTSEINARVPYVAVADVKRVIGELADEGRLVPVEMPVDDGSMVAAWTHPDFARAARPDGRLILLSPFDPLIKDRERTERLFGFRYRLEMYVPREQRQYGHFVLPALLGERLIGRVAPEMDRRAGVLRVRGIFTEDGGKAPAAMTAALHELAEFVGAREVAYD